MIQNLSYTLDVTKPLSFNNGGSSTSSEAEFNALLLEKFFPIGTVICLSSIQESVVFNLGGIWERLNQSNYICCSNETVGIDSVEVPTTASDIVITGNASIAPILPNHTHTLNITTAGQTAQHAHNNIPTNANGAVQTPPDFNDHWRPESYSAGNNGRQLELSADWSTHTHNIAGVTTQSGTEASLVALNPLSVDCVIYRRIQ